MKEDLVSITGSILAPKSDFSISVENVDFVLCLDTLTQALGNEDASALYMHVSKPPKEGTPMNNFFKHLKQTAAQYGNITIDGVHKKINLADQQLAWEHERFSMKRLPAFTLSSLKSAKEPVRNTIFRDNEARIISQTHLNAKIIAEALGKHLFNFALNSEKQHSGESNDNIFVGSTHFNENTIKAYLNLKSAVHNNDMKNSFEKYLKNVKLMFDKPDTRDPDFMFYDGQDAKLNVYKVKPAVFDLFLTSLICAYLAAVYAVIQYFPNIYDIACKLSKIQVTPMNSYSPSNHYNNHDYTGASSERMKLK